MGKQEFLAALGAKLTGIPKNDLEERISFYGEMIDDRIEEGLTEEQAIADLGTIESVYTQIMSEISLTKLVKEKVKPNRALRGWEIVLLVLGAPVWLSLFLALLAIVISGYAVIGSVMISSWAIELSVAVCSAAGIFASVLSMVKGNIAAGAAMLGVGVLCGGLLIFGWYGCKGLSHVLMTLTRKGLIGLKRCFEKKEATK